MTGLAFLGAGADLAADLRGGDFFEDLTALIGFLVVLDMSAKLGATTPYPPKDDKAPPGGGKKVAEYRDDPRSEQDKYVPEVK